MTRHPNHFAILGHRGSPRAARENALPSFDLALREGADGFETDVRTLRDGSIVLFHDHDVGAKAVESFSFSELAAIAPDLARLEDLSRHVGTCAITLEIKRSGGEEAITRLVRDWPGITISSFDHRVLRRMREAGYGGRLGVIFAGYLDDVATYSSGLDAAVIYPEYHLVDSAMVTACSDAGIEVVAWTANDRAVWSDLLAAGCQGIVTDLPGEAALWRRGAR